jgi:hypothetical protein
LLAGFGVFGVGVVREGQVTMKKPSSFLALIGLVTLVAASITGPASAVPPPHPPHPLHPGTNPTVGTSTVNVPVTCTFGSPSPVFPTTAHVSVTAPAVTYPNAPYTASFLVSLDGLVAPLDVESFTLTSTYNVSGPVNPNGTITFTEPAQSLAAGASPTFTTFTQTFAPGALGTVSYRFDAVSYDFAFAGTDNIHADCALDNGPVVVRETTI